MAHRFAFAARAIGREAAVVELGFFGRGEMIGRHDLVGRHYVVVVDEWLVVDWAARQYTGIERDPAQIPVPLLAPLSDLPTLIWWQPPFEAGRDYVRASDPLDAEFGQSAEPDWPPGDQVFLSSRRAGIEATRQDRQRLI